MADSDDKKLCIIDEENKKILVYDKSNWSEMRSVRNVISDMKSMFHSNVKIDWHNDDEIKRITDSGYQISKDMNITINLS